MTEFALANTPGLWLVDTIPFCELNLREVQLDLILYSEIPSTLDTGYGL